MHTSENRMGSISLHLEHLHCTLLQLYSTASHNDTIEDPGVSIQNLSDTFDILYKELIDRISCFLHESDVLSHNELLQLSSILKEDGLHSGTWSFTRDIVLLLRCCLIIVRLLDFMHCGICGYTLDKCQVLVNLMVKLRSWNNLKLFPNKETSSYLCTSEEIDHTNGLRCSLVEVFVDELLLYRCSRELFKKTDLSSSTNVNLFASHYRSSHNCALLEIASAHFILSFDHATSLSKFRCSLFWSNEKDRDVPHLSLEAIILLMRSIVLCSAPYIFQAHFILLASKVVRSYFSPNIQKQNVALLDKYISAFDISVNMYVSLMSNFLLDIDRSEENIYQQGSCRLGYLFHESFNNCIQPTTHAKINSLVVKLAEYSDRFSNSMLSESKEDNITSAMDFFKEKLHLIDEKFREETYLFLKSVLSVITSFESKSNVFKLKQSNWQEIHCIAAFLNLMNNLLFQIFLGFKDRGSIKNSKVYEALTVIMNSFNLSWQNERVSKIRSDHLTLKNSENDGGIHLMLRHFIYMLLFSLHCGTEHLWRGCIVMILSLLNLLILKDGNLESLNSLISYTTETFVSPPPSPLKVAKKRQSYRGSTFVIASNFQKIQDLYLQKPTNLFLCGNTSMEAEEANENQSRNSGKEYLKLLEQKTEDVDDLADFVEFREGKDYSVWWKNWQKFREWKYKARTSVRWKQTIKKSSLSKSENLFGCNTRISKRSRGWKQ